MKSAIVRICLIVCVAFPALFLGARLFSQEKSASDAPSQEQVRDRADSEMKYLDLKLQADLDSDGTITEDEWNRLFVEMDENGDRRLSQGEVHQAFSGGDGDTDLDQGRASAFDRLDKNGNGAIELSEWPEKGKGKNKAPSFLYLDGNRDDSLSREEFMSLNARWWNQVFENIDLDKNGLIVRTEWMDSIASFDRLDQNRDGYIGHSEFYNPQ